MENASPELFKDSKIVYRNIINQLKNILVASLDQNEISKVINEEFNFLIQYSLFNIATNNDTKKISFLEMLFIVNIGDIDDEDFKYRLDSRLRDNTHKKWSYLLFSDRSPNDSTIYLFKNKMFEFMEPIKKKIISFFKKNQIKKNSVLVEMIFKLYDLFFKIDNRTKKNNQEILINEIKDTFDINIKLKLKKISKNEF